MRSFKDRAKDCRESYGTTIFLITFSTFMVALSNALSESINDYKTGHKNWNDIGNKVLPPYLIARAVLLPIFPTLVAYCASKAYFTLRKQGLFKKTPNPSVNNNSPRSPLLSNQNV